MTAGQLPPFETHVALVGSPHGFFGRRGGVSTGLYGSLNCGIGSKDDRALVMENRARVAASLGVEISDTAKADRRGHLLTCHQIHSAEAVVVTEPWTSDNQPKADAIVTRTPGLVLGALAADCMPILFADTDAGIVAAAHAGWRGAIDGVEAATIAAMVGIGARKSRIQAVIGPCISQRAYEVGPEFRDVFTARDTAFARFFSVPDGQTRPHFDLPGFMLAKLQSAGIGHASWIGACTYADEIRWFSYRRTTHRREPDYGRQIAAITLPR